MILGYARTSTLDQVAGFEAQRRDLESAGCERVFAEQVSSIGQATGSTRRSHLPVKGTPSS